MSKEKILKKETVGSLIKNTTLEIGELAIKLSIWGATAALLIACTYAVSGLYIGAMVHVLAPQMFPVIAPFVEPIVFAMANSVNFLTGVLGSEAASALLFGGITGAVFDIALFSSIDSFDFLVKKPYEKIKSSNSYMRKLFRKILSNNKNVSIVNNKDVDNITLPEERENLKKLQLIEQKQKKSEEHVAEKDNVKKQIATKEPLKEESLEQSSVEMTEKERIKFDQDVDEAIESLGDDFILEKENKKTKTADSVEELEVLAENPLEEEQKSPKVKNNKKALRVIRHKGEKTTMKVLQHKQDISMDLKEAAGSMRPSVNKSNKTKANTSSRTKKPLPLKSKSSARE